jgi:mono/diheme cytochrome c family protein
VTATCCSVPAPAVKDRLAALLSLAVVFALLAAGLPASAQLGDPIKGQALFVSKGCVQCHAIRGSGGRIGPDLGRTATKGSFFEIAATMWNHSLVMSEKMQEFRFMRPVFEGSDLADLLAFLYFLNYFDEPGDPKAGKVLFLEKHCIQCHGLGKVGGNAGPRLDTLSRGTSPLRIAQDLWNHGPVMIPAIRRMGLDVPQFQGNEILDLFAYLRSQGHRETTRDFRSSGDSARGRSLFASKGCVRCHTVFGRDNVIGPDLGRTDLRGSVTQLAGRMWNHWPAMSEAMGTLGMASPTFKGEDLADVFAYLFVSRYEGPRGDIRRGLHLYRDRKCTTCHGETGGGAVAVSLHKAIGETKEQILQRMWNAAPKMWARMGAAHIAWPRFDADDLSALVTLLADGWKTAPASPESSRKSTAR